MASTFKNLSPNDKISTKTLLHEAIPITGTIVSGTYADNNIKNYSHGMFQSVYDYPYLSSSANHIFDVTVGMANASALSASSPPAVAQQTKKINLYNQMAQVLVGYDRTGSVQQFDEDGDLSAGNKLNECIFLSFSRLLVKDEIKKGSFNLELGVNGDYADPFSKRIKIIDESADTSFKVNSPVGEYGILVADSTAGTNLNDEDGTLAAGQKCGLIFYQAGVAVLSGSVFLSDAASVTIRATNAPTIGNEITITTTDASNETFTCTAATTDADEFGRNGSQHGIDNLKASIEASTIAAKVTVSAVSEPATGEFMITVTQVTAGATGNKAVANNCANYSVGGAAAASAGAFTGGGSGGILLPSVGSPSMNLDGETINGLLTGSSISGSADALRHRIYNLQFNNTVELNSSIYFCRINHNEYNYSANPTYLSSSQIRVKAQASDVPVSYVTTVGLYSADNQLLAVGKLSEPLRKDPTIEYTLRARLDY